MEVPLRFALGSYLPLGYVDDAIGCYNAMITCVIKCTREGVPSNNNTSTIYLSS